MQAELVPVTYDGLPRVLLVSATSLRFSPALNYSVHMGLLRRVFRRYPGAIEQGSASKNSTQKPAISNQSSNVNTINGTGDVFNYSQNINYFMTADMPIASVSCFLVV